MSLAPTEYWDEFYRQVPLNIAPSGDIIRHWLQCNIPEGNNSTCLEIGCFPGRYLAVLGMLGYKLFGIDSTERVLSDLPSWLKGQGFRVGEFYREDFFTFAIRSDMTFDVVCSFGFIEHFVNWQELIDLHARKVAAGGLLVISVPNFSGLLQKSLHSIFDAENLKRHNIDAMCPQKWKEQLESEGFQVLFAGPVGGFDFWTDSPNVNAFQVAGAALIQKIGYLPFMRNLPSCSLYSPFHGIIARKNS